MTLIETIDKIKELRQEAEAVGQSHLYDPCGHAEARAKRLRELADRIEEDMEIRLKWRPGVADCMMVMNENGECYGDVEHRYPPLGKTCYCGQTTNEADPDVDLW